MPVEIVDKGEGNRVELHPWFEKSGRLKIVFSGNGNLVRIPEPPRDCNGMVIQLGENCVVDIGAACGLSNSFIFAARDGEVRIGARCSFTARTRFIMHEASCIRLGWDCMIAADVQFMTSDNHTIYSLETGQRTNPAADIEIGDHVWIGLQCIVVKGGRIGSGSVIGLRSVVTDSIPRNCLAVGTPARVLRTDVGWDRKLWRKDNSAETRQLPDSAEPLLP